MATCLAGTALHSTCSSDPAVPPGHEPLCNQQNCRGSQHLPGDKAPGGDIHHWDLLTCLDPGIICPKPLGYIWCFPPWCSKYTYEHLWSCPAAVVLKGVMGRKFSMMLQLLVLFFT